VPAVIFGAIAGVYVDRHDRRMLLVLTNAVRGALFIGLIFFDQQVALIYLFTILISTMTTFFGPAEAAMIPVIVDRRQLLAANSMYVFTLQASFFVGFAVLGPLVINLYDLSVLLWIVGALFFVAAALCWTLPPHNPRLGAHRPAQALTEAGSAVATTFGQLRDGLRFIAQHHNVFWPLTYLAITASLIGVLGVLGPGFATEALGLTERDFVIVVLPLGAGLVMGILLLNAYGRYIPRRRGIEAGLVGLGVTLAALSVAQPVTTALANGLISLLSVVVVVAFVAGIGYAFVAVPAQTQLQEELPPEIRGRVFGVLNMLISIASFLPIIAVGPIADVVGTSPVVLASALFVLVAAAGSLAWARPAHPAAGSPAGLLEPMDPVGVTSRSLTQPIRVRYLDDDENGGDGLSYLSSPVVPGRAGPANKHSKE
jgi:MFS family permease